MQQIILRPDQARLEADIYAGWNVGKRNMLAQLPTGGGKSVILSEIVMKKDAIGSKQVVIAHRTELVSQLSLHMALRGIKHRLIAPKNVIAQIIRQHRKEFNGFSYINPSANCAVGGVDTILARKDELKNWAEQLDHWYIDEAHHVLLLNKWGKCVSMFKNALGLGVTATPERADGAGLGILFDGVFHTLVSGPTMRCLITARSLSDYEIVVPESDFEIDDNLPPSGDFSQKKMREASKKSHITGDVVTNYVQYAFGKRAIVFATDVETSNEIARNFNDFGISAASVSAKTPAEVRADFIQRFRDGRLTVLVNVDLFGEGFDVPAVEVVIMARPTASLAVYLQQFGRVLRVMEGKPFGLVIDHVSNYKRHGLPDKPRIWTLDRRQKRAKKERDPEDMPMMVCTECSRPYDAAFLACPHCGHVPEIEVAARGSIEQVEGDLVLLSREVLAEMRQQIELETPAAAGQKVGFVAGPAAAAGAVNRSIARHASQVELKETIEQWAGIQRHKGRSDQESYKRFFYGAGVDVLSALSQPKAKMDALKFRIEEWIDAN